ncbi:uncharacterized oxidoreductase YoxD-like [Sitodiplosis mosellana]|uniref:uncharacterized oxidoreductase YoxD-like n=1 Tax=Sitodiplosis mosellana TaxID=263140 RepID=UPI002443F7C4|nr:uncharacterized oxidoreductase YoxD-like [Sitodiplosis mosellana]XP_055311359.1 uncharacterized oxidoreductase YoxD-like [Sitodiplosis mosellana]XP_055311367.1 uncharacterized oxidoreductase YoxD-like [Sitodiplosis mosellana]XP_055311376.1 uncharacterized oxidoreductase YoxD-like [Sitodiplosis mosellana]XP_055311386.1 uncharacterized oxidoreductase YoxD-like [Sitodiplosis mosellana]
MEDVHTFHTKSYERADDLEVLCPSRRAIMILKLLPGLIVKTLIVIVLELYYLLLALFHLIFPRWLKDIRGQLAAVTGGSNGIGREICLELARNGCNVACLDLDLDAAEKLCAEMRAMGVKANPYHVEVTDYEALERVKEEINADMGVVDILINNAGLMPQNSFRDGDPKSVSRVMDVNVLSHFWTTRIFIGDMIARGHGLIVGISSMIAFYPMSMAVTYTTSKYAVKGFMDALNQESRHEGWGVKTLTIFPHICSTRKEIIDYVKRIVDPTTLERVGLLTPVEVGRVTVEAIRDGSRYATVPRFYLFVGKFLQALPSKVQDIADDMYMPRVNSKKTYTTSALDKNGCKKSH